MVKFKPGDKVCVIGSDIFRSMTVQHSWWDVNAQKRMVSVNEFVTYFDERELDFLGDRYRPFYCSCCGQEIKKHKEQVKDRQVSFCPSCGKLKGFKEGNPCSICNRIFCYECLPVRKLHCPSCEKSRLENEK